MTTWNAAPMPELGLELVRDVDAERIRSRLPRWDPRLWGDAQFSKNTRQGNRLLKLGLAWGRERVKAQKLQQETLNPRSEYASVSRFTGKEEDVEVGLTYFGKRYLSPYLGRWISADPLAVHAPGEADLNLYAYVHGAVLKSVDPFGLEEKVKASDVASNVAAGQVPLYAAYQEWKAGNYFTAFLRANPTTNLLIMAPIDAAQTFKATSESIGSCAGGVCGAKEKTQLISVGLNLAIGAVAARVMGGKAGAGEVATGEGGAHLRVINIVKGKTMQIEFPDGKGYITIDLDAKSKTMTVAEIQSFEKGKGNAHALYNAALEAGTGVMGEVKTINGLMAWDNAKALTQKGVEGTPAGHMRDKLGFTQHSYDAATGVLTSTRPPPAPAPNGGPPATAAGATTSGQTGSDEKAK